VRQTGGVVAGGGRDVALDGGEGSHTWAVVDDQATYTRNIRAV
jgi:hypothetical protein